MPDKWHDGNMPAVKRLTIATTSLLIAMATTRMPAQTPSPSDHSADTMAQLQVLAKKIDEQNAKIDTLSQQILKLQQELAEKRPGVVIGQPETPAPPAPPVAAGAETAGGNTHIVARGETLTSIAKQYKVTVDDLQRVNHIEDGRRLQAGQSITIPTGPVQPGSPSPSASPAPSE